MGKNFAELKAQAPLEALVGASAVLRGIYVLIADFYGKTTTVTTSSALYNIVLGTAFILSGLLLIIGALKNHLPFRFVGLILVAFVSGYISINRIIAEQGLLPLGIGNVALVAVSIWLMLLLLQEEKQ